MDRKMWKKTDREKEENGELLKIACSMSQYKKK